MHIMITIIINPSTAYIDNTILRNINVLPVFQDINNNHDIHPNHYTCKYSLTLLAKLYGKNYITLRTNFSANPAVNNIL